ncbi:MAG TPA: hypothetical protein VK196_18175 [Magnetospirillum sp.]|nr:hypothetical protein [Magnetospirillum sp.]
MSKTLAKWRSIAKYNKGELYFTTIVLSAIPLTQDTNWESVTQRINADWDTFKTDWRNLVSHRFPKTIWRAVLEYDLVKVGDIGTHHQALFKDMGIDLSGASWVLVPHTHMLVKPTIPLKNFKGWLNAKWQGSYRCHTEPLYQKQTCLEAVINLHGYCHKKRTQYKDGGIGDMKAVFLNDYDEPWKSRITMLHQEDIDFCSKE